ncbi:DNA recombination protein RecO [Bacillus cytotoxicus]|uniref:DNA recombination protein RecO n=1 Tax=unclassified Bacillus cereus group TaxID=2750818 RepID=UPI001F5A9697|nr:MULTISPECIES: DNA recombination protein RecO [unclassified Bacillus cereus group]EMA6341533.1 DNA recombination protein RecO [Bacillus cytotoxicus]
MIWLILFLPAVTVWVIVTFVHIKSGESNHHYHEPFIFHSQRIPPFRIEEDHANEMEKSYRKR